MPRLPARAPLPGRRRSGESGAGCRGGASPPHARARAHARTHPRDQRPLARERESERERERREGKRGGSRARLCPHAPRTARPGEGERGGIRRRDPAPPPAGPRRRGRAAGGVPSRRAGRAGVSERKAGGAGRLPCPPPTHTHTPPQRGGGRRAGHVWEVPRRCAAERPVLRGALGQRLRGPSQPLQHPFFSPPRVALLGVAIPFFFFFYPRAT